MNYPYYIIGEIGSCHEGFLDQALAMIRHVNDQEHAFADAVKFQYFHSGEAVAAKRKAPEYAAMYDKYRLPAEWLPELHQHALDYGSDFICTVYLTEDIPVVAPYVDKFKIASCDALDRKFVEAHLKYDKPILISTGLLNEEELMRMLALRAEVGHDRIKLLHCVSAYPCPVEQVHLKIIKEYDLDGFSDHTANPLMGALAYMAGARIFEAHVRSRTTTKDNPDYPHALDPEQWNQYVSNIHLAATATGHRIKQTQPAEEELRRFLA
jgi:N,N'-diacetyllegionaminate synthase